MLWKTKTCSSLDDHWRLAPTVRQSLLLLWAVWRIHTLMDALGAIFLYLAQGHVNSNSTHEGKHDILINLIKDKFSINSAANLLCYAAENILDFLQSEKNVFKFCLCCCFFFTCPWKCWFNCSETDWNTCSKHFYWINRRSRPQRATF